MFTKLLAKGTNFEIEMTFVVENGEVHAPTKMPGGTLVIVEGTKMTFVGLRRIRYSGELRGPVQRLEQF